jgi:hypothetical protein
MIAVLIDATQQEITHGLEQCMVKGGNIAKNLLVYFPELEEAMDKEKEKEMHKSSGQYVYFMFFICQSLTDAMQLQSEIEDYDMEALESSV